jgi:hypothetical protein
MQVNDRALYAYQYYLSKGLSPEVAAGIVANLAIESGNFSPSVISGDQRGDKGSAHYVQQLRHGRKDNFEEFAKSTNRSPTDLNAQLDFVLEELNPDSQYADVQAAKNRDAILGARDPHSAAQNFMAHYERASKNPKLNHIDKRLDYAGQLYGQTPNVTAAIQPPPPGQQPAQSLDEQQVAQMRQAQTMYDDPGVSFTGLGMIRAGEILSRKRSPLSYQSAYAPLGGSTDVSMPTQTELSSSFRPDPSSVPDKAVPLGKDTSLQAASTTLQFGIKPAGDHVNIDGIQPQAREALTLAANQLGRDITISSGYRSQAHQDRIRNSGDPNRITVAKESRHTHGDASDISTAGMSQEEIAKLVDALAGNGFNAFGYYPTHIHADMRSAVPKSFNPDTNWGGWTKLPPEVMAVLVQRGFRPGLSADQIRRGFTPS